MENLMCPKLRFRGFSDVWLKTKLGTLGNFVGGGTPSSKNPEHWKGDIPWISSSDINQDSIFDIRVTRHITEKAVSISATKVVPAKSVLIVSRVGVGKVAVNEKEICTSQDFTNIVPIDTNYIFLAYLIKMNTCKLLGLNQGTSIKGFVKSALEGLELSLPTVAEQQKIATFLSAVDDKTQQLNKKKALLERYKKGVMQQIFSQEIRFKDDEGKDYPKWQKKRLGDVVTRVSTKNKQVSSNVLTISAQEGLISQLKYFNNSVAGKSLFGYTLIMRDDFAYNKSYSKGYPMGAIKRLTRYEKGIVSTLYICFRTNKDITPQFAEHYFESGRQNQEIEKVAQEGARNHGLLNIGVGDFFSIEMDLPCVPEQTKIACFLSALDDIIGHVNQQTELIKQYKIGLLQQMFV